MKLPNVGVNSFALATEHGITLELRKSRFHDVERALGLSVPYPLAGWASWSARRGDGVAVLSASFVGGTLRAVEWYLARGAPPPLTPGNLGEITLQPAGIRLAQDAAALPPQFTEFSGGGPVFDRTLSVPCDGGIVFCMVLDGRIVRIALYAS